MPQSKEVEDFLRSIGPFYEEVEEEGATTQPNIDTVKNESAISPEQLTINDAVTLETITDAAKEKKEFESDSEEEIFSDPIATPESSLSVSSIHITVVMSQLS